MTLVIHAFAIAQRIITTITSIVDSIAAIVVAKI